MRQHSGAPAPKWNRRITRRIFPPDSEKSSGNETMFNTDNSNTHLYVVTYRHPLFCILICNILWHYNRNYLTHWATNAAPIQGWIGRFREVAGVSIDIAAGGPR